MSAVALRYCLPRVPKRGYGLGNELIPWAKSHLRSDIRGRTCSDQYRSWKLIETLNRHKGLGQ